MFWVSHTISESRTTYHQSFLSFVCFSGADLACSQQRAICVKRQLAITWNPWKCQIDGSDSGWWTSVLWMHMNATKFWSRNTNTVEIQNRVEIEHNGKSRGVSVSWLSGVDGGECRSWWVWFRDTGAIVHLVLYTCGLHPSVHSYCTYSTYGTYIHTAPGVSIISKKWVFYKGWY